MDFFRIPATRVGPYFIKAAILFHRLNMRTEGCTDVQPVRAMIPRNPPAENENLRLHDPPFYHATRNTHSADESCTGRRRK